MKAVLGTALFACANLAVYYTSPFFQRERAYHQAVTAAAQRTDIGVLLLGDSHVDKIPQEYLDPIAYNVAAGGDGYRECYAKLRYLLGQSSGIRTIVLTADYHMFGAGRAQSANRSFVDRYLLAAGASEGYEKGRLSAAFNLVPLFNDDYVQYLKKALRAKFQRAAEADMAVAARWEDVAAQVRRERATKTGQGDHLGVGAAAEPLLWYQRIIELARDHDVDVVAVRFPADADYLGQIPAEGGKVVDQALDRLRIQPIDLSRALQSPTYFENEDHVNATGAAALVCLLQARTALNLGSQDVLRQCP